MNLYLYIPPKSAHPPGMIKGVIFSLLKNFKHQNTEKTDYIKMVTLLFRRLIARGWNSHYLLPIFIEADNHTVPTTPPPPKRQTLPRDTIILHMEYHPHDIPRKIVRKIFEKNCSALSNYRCDSGEELGIKKLIIAYSRPKNLQDILSPTTLNQAEDKRVTEIMGEVD